MATELSTLLADYVVIRRGEDLMEEMGREKTRGSLYDYLFAGNGVFLRAARPGLEVCIPVSRHEVRGLAHIEPYVKLAHERVPASFLKRMFNYAREVCVRKGEPVEALFYLRYREDIEFWQISTPEQRATSSSVRPADDQDEEYREALIELHSHHQMDAFFSSQDDQDEQGFRIYAVIGEIFTNNRVRVRVGCYGHFFEVPARDIFELPEGVQG